MFLASCISSKLPGIKEAVHFSVSRGAFPDLRLRNGNNGGGSSRKYQDCAGI